MSYFVYILSGSGKKSYQIGITNDLIGDVYNSMTKEERESGIKKKKLLHYEIFDDPIKAKMRKKQLERALLTKQ